jgi:hypothetical protein
MVIMGLPAAFAQALPSIGRWPRFMGREGAQALITSKARCQVGDTGVFD